MTRDDIQKWQAKKIRDLSPAGNYLARLLERMEKRGFPPRPGVPRLDASEGVMPAGRRQRFVRRPYLSTGSAALIAPTSSNGSKSAMAPPCSTR